MKADKAYKALVAELTLNTQTIKVLSERNIQIIQVTKQIETLVGSRIDMPGQTETEQSKGRTINRRGLSANVMKLLSDSKVHNVNAMASKIFGTDSRDNVTAVASACSFLFLQKRVTRQGKGQYQIVSDEFLREVEISKSTTARIGHDTRVTQVGQVGQ